MPTLPLIIGALIRWAITAAGASAGLQGFITEDDIVTASGAIAALSSLAWSVYQKRPKT